MSTLKRRSQINNLGFHLRELEKEEQIKPKANGRKEIKISVEINKMENRKTIERINEATSWLFVRINKIDK